MKIRLVRKQNGTVRVMAGSTELALIKVGRGEITVVSECLAGAGTPAGPYTQSVRMGPTEDQHSTDVPAITIRFEKQRG